VIPNPNITKRPTLFLAGICNLQIIGIGNAKTAISKAKSRVPITRNTVFLCAHVPPGRVGSHPAARGLHRANAAKAARSDHIAMKPINAHVAMRKLR